jgi:hypothetical protein
MMAKPFHFAAATLATILACSTAGAQMRGGVSAMRVPAMRVAPSVRISIAASRTAQQARVIRISPNGRLNSGFATGSFGNSTSFGNSNGVPGLGFDYPHLAAISGGLRNGQPLNSGRGFHRGQASFVPILIGGYPYYPDSIDYEQPEEQPQQQPQQQPQVIVIQQPVPAAQQMVDPGNAPAISPAPPIATPVRDVVEFILVKRDGRILFASAFMVGGTQLTYVTPEGIRRTLPLSELDADATQQMNEARGTSVQLHN